MASALLLAQGLLGRLVVAVALAVSAYVHLDLAGTYDPAGDSITLGDLFRVQGIVAAVAAVAVLVPRRLTLWLASAVGLASFLAVCLSYYVRIPAIGPLPELYEPVWLDSKTVSAVSAAVAAVVGGLLLLRRRRG